MRTFKTTIFILLIFMLLPYHTLAVGVQPLVVDLSIKPGETKQFKIDLIPTRADGVELVNASLFGLVQNLTGALTYEPPTQDKYPYLSWVKLDNASIEVTNGQYSSITGSVTVPYNTSGAYTIVVMVDPTLPEVRSGIRLNVRYAVRLNINVNSAGLNPKATLSDFNLSVNDENVPIIKGTITNSSNTNFLVSGEATIRDCNQRLVDRIPLKSLYAINSDLESTRMYPKSQVEFMGRVTKRLSPGEYTLRAFFRYGEHGQIVESKKITLAEESLNFPNSDETNFFSVDRQSLDLNLEPGQTKSELLLVTNNTGETTRIFVELKGIDPDYQYSAAEWVQLRSLKEISIPGYRESRTILTITVPRDTKASSNHGKVLLTAYSSDGTKMLGKHEIPLSVTVGSDHTYSAEIRSVVSEPLADSTLFSLDLNNNGNIRIAPSAKLILFTEKGDQVETVDLSLPDDVQGILPLRSEQLTGTAKKLSPGLYRVKITISRGNEQLLTDDQIIEIK